VGSVRLRHGHRHRRGLAVGVEGSVRRRHGHRRRRDTEEEVVVGSVHRHGRRRHRRHDTEVVVDSIRHRHKEEVVVVGNFRPDNGNPLLQALHQAVVRIDQMDSNAGNHLAPGPNEKRPNTVAAQLRARHQECCPYSLKDNSSLFRFVPGPMQNIPDRLDILDNSVRIQLKLEQKQLRSKSSLQERAVLLLTFEDGAFGFSFRVV